jgi:hypothetical protein
MKFAIPALLVGSVAGCTGSITGGIPGLGDDGPREDIPPVIEIYSPQRGIFTEDSVTEIQGKVTDNESGVQSVSVNGQPVVLDDDGTFTGQINLPPGITLIETVATDLANNTANDSRSVLAGQLGQLSYPVADGVVAHLSSLAMQGYGGLISDLANNTNFTALATALNPVVNTGDGCNSAKIYVNEVAHEGVEVEIAPENGGLGTPVAIRGLRIPGRVTFRALCIGGSANWTIRADAYDVGGKIVPTLVDSSIDIGLDNVTSGFRGFNLDVGGIPGFIEDLFEGRARDALAGILRGKITEMVPPLATDFLAEFLSDAWSVSILGQQVDFSVYPSAMTWTAEGGLIVVDTKSTIPGFEDAMYLSTPTTRPSPNSMAAPGIRFAVADDVLNQLLSALWASGALEDVLLPVDGDQLSAAFGADVASASVTLVLPPVASFDTQTGTGRLTIGDLQVDATGQGGETLASIVISAEIDLAVETSSDGRVKVITRAARIAPQILEQSDTLLTPLDNAKVSAIADVAIKQLSSKADDLLGSLPVPGLAGATVMSPTFQSASGYLLMGGQIAFE